MGRKRRCLGYLIDLYETWGKPDRAVEYERRLRLLEEPDADG